MIEKAGDVIIMDGRDKIILENVTKADLDKADFLF